MGTWKRCVGRNFSREKRYEHRFPSTRSCGWAAKIPTCDPRVCRCMVMPGTHGKRAQRINCEGQRKESANRRGCMLRGSQRLGENSIWCIPRVHQNVDDHHNCNCAVCECGMLCGPQYQLLENLMRTRSSNYGSCVDRSSFF